MKTLFLLAALAIQQLTADVKFREMQDDGTIVYEGQDPDTGRDLYMIMLPDSSVAHYAYREEAIEYIKTGTFKYNDFIK
jgi:hypothetical protein